MPVAHRRHVSSCRGESFLRQVLPVKLTSLLLNAGTESYSSRLCVQQLFDLDFSLKRPTAFVDSFEAFALEREIRDMRAQISPVQDYPPEA